MAMEKLKKLNNNAYEWLKQIPPQSWANSLFTGRAHCDALLNNLCEAFNSKHEEGRDAPIITCIELEVRQNSILQHFVVTENIKLLDLGKISVNKVARAKGENSREYHANIVWLLFRTWGGITRMWVSQNHLCIHVTGYQAGKRCILLKLVQSMEGPCHTPKPEWRKHSGVDELT
uniref:Uncharacterized protein n=1 Tax=Lactuca sativa TaxID=4236 RepID=A0A9R1WC60_LACSA|nr:hypothetical protein LSAT_V11C200070150 [Lactuca sativa]